MADQEVNRGTPGPQGPSGSSEKLPPTIRVGLQPGDIGAITRLHGELYAREQHFSVAFEAYVGETLSRFALEESPGSRIWIAERAGEVVGSIAVVGHDEATAQLRWFLITPDVRGLGLGGRLFEEALNFCRDRRVRKVFLWTVAGLPVSHHLYTAAGFRLADEHEHSLWGRPVVEQQYELLIA